MYTYEYYANKFKTIAKKSYKSKHYEKAMAAIASYAGLSYEWNQFYSDEEIEKITCDISEKIFLNVKDKNTYKKNKNTVLFYDGFGTDTRGLAIIYAKALINLNYKVIWVTKKKVKDKIPEIEKVLSGGNAQIEYIDMHHTYCSHICELNSVFEKYKPEKAFFYTLPNDVAAVVVFRRYEDVVKRFQINLTDHAYWLGTCAFDVCIEFRDYGAGITLKYRNVPLQKVKMLPYYPWIDKNIDFQGFPFETKGKKILFSGGYLYKTIGGANKYYKIVDKVLQNNDNLIFLYAGAGDDSELKKLIQRYENRVYHIAERKDLFALLEHIDVYFNTYPLIGGLMTQYAAMAGKVPIILNDMETEDASGILLNQKEAGIEFDSVEKVVVEINKLLQDDEYRKQRNKGIKQHVSSETEFEKSLNDIMQDKKESFYAPCPDTEKFRKEYIGRFNKKTIVDVVARKKNFSILLNFPILFLIKVKYILIK